MLTDTGPLVAILDRDDAAHRRCVAVLKQIPPPLVTTWPVVTEAMYLLAFSSKAQDALLAMVERGSLQVAVIGAEDVPRIRVLVRTYRDLPMDLADATMVRVAEREGIREVFTLDRRDFSVYRAGRGRSFSIIP